LPKGTDGRIGLAVSGADSKRVWALVENADGGLFRSDDAGATWQLLTQDRNLRQRAWYFSKLTADPKDTNTVWAGNVGGYRSTDGGKTFRSNPVNSGDTHQYWVAPNDPGRVAVVGDQGVTLTYDGGKTTSRANIPTGQYYHVHLTNAFPYDVCGAEQDGGVDCFPGRYGVGGGRGGRGRGGFGGPGGPGGRGGRGGAPAEQFDFPPRYGGAGGESGYVASDPLDPDVTFGGNYSGVLEMQNKRTGQSMRLDPWPLNPMGHDAKDSKYRFQWTFPIMNSPNDPKVLYAGSNVLFRSTDLGMNWKIVSPDLTRNDPATLGASGGPLTKDQTSVEYYGTIFATAESPVAKGTVWTGSDDGLIYVSKNVGVAGVAMPTWTNVTPKDLPKWTRISIIEPSHFNAGTMYFAANRYEMDDFAPYLYRTTDYGKTWTKIIAGIPGDEFTRSIREDLVRPGLLYAATERSMYISYDAGAHWQSFKRGLPPVAVHDIALRDDDIVIATMGRGFYAMEGISALREADKVGGAAHLYKPGVTYQTTGSVAVQYWLDKPGQVVTLELVDAKGRVVHKAASNDTVPSAGRGGRGGGGGRGGFGPPPARVTNTEGLNTFDLPLRYPDGMNFQNAIYWGGNGLNGPLGPPGNYTVRMTVGDAKPLVQPVRVRKDPRTTATEADLVEKFNFLMRIRDTVSAANKAVRTIRNARDQVDSIRKIIPDAHRADFTREADAMVDSTRSTEEQLYQTKNEAGEDPLNFPIRINNQVGALSGFITSNDRRPPPQAYEVWNTLIPQLDKQLLRLDTQWKVMLPKVNAVLKAAGMAPIVLSSDEKGAPRPTFVP
ncbi:MAG TPA: glycosyl hydrolase, partial [Gemmatimonadaceae bacterium]|nr:glycosyl hydrolase [Gemmatimonadaceae bacterium]